MLEQLRQTLRALEKPALLEDAAGFSPLGIESIDATLGGGLTYGTLHEIAAVSEAHLTAATGFTLGLVAMSPSPRVPTPVIPGRERSERTWNDEENARGKGLVWITEDMGLAESGAPYGGGLEAFGLAPKRLITVAAAKPRDLLWAMEEALRCRAVRAVIGEWRHDAIDAVAVRRLSLAAAETGALALMLRASPADDASTAATRWIVGGTPSAATAHGPGVPRFAAELVRNRRGPLGAWILEWSDSDGFRLAHAQPLALPLLDRPHRPRSRRVA